MVAATGVAVLPTIAAGVLATFLIDDLSLSRTQLGLAVAAASVVSAVGSLTLGSITDRRGARAALVSLFVTAGLSLVVLAAATAFVWLAAAALLCGVCLALSNPATNRIVAERIAPGRHGVVTGIKQSGEMVAFLVAGVLMPLGALALGWRWTVALASVVAWVAALLTLFVVPPSDQVAPAGPSDSPITGGISPGVYVLAALTLFMGLAGGSITTYLPLYAEEAVGLPVTQAGATMAVIGLVAIVGRIGWSHAAGRLQDPSRALLLMAPVGIVAGSVIWAASHLGAPLLWLGVVLWGFSAFSMAAVAMVALIGMVPLAGLGRASGLVLAGMSVGLTLGPPIFGAAVDISGTYDAGFVLVVASFVGATALLLAWRARPREASGVPA